MKRRIGLPSFISIAVYSLIAVILLLLILFLTNEYFPRIYMGIIALSGAIIAVISSFVGTLLLDFKKHPSKAGYIFQMIGDLFALASAVCILFLPFEEKTSWKPLLMFLGLIGSGLGITYFIRSFFAFKFSDFDLEEVQDKQEKPKKVDVNYDNVIEVDSVDVVDKKGD